MRTKGISAFCAIVAVLVCTVWTAFFAHAKQAPKTQSGTMTHASVLAVSDPMTTGSEAVPTGDTQGEIQSDVLHPTFALNGLIASWPKTLEIDDESLRLEVRVKNHDLWSAWIPLPVLHDAPTGAALPRDRRYSEPVFVDAEEFQYRTIGDVTGVALETFREVTFTYIDSRSARRRVSWAEKLFGIRRAAAEPTLSIIPRSEWGADEQYRFSGEQELWQRTYHPVEKFILHHTAGSNGGDDPAAVVRGIYYFHAVVLGWGDIGYNYLIDPAGRVYEGRYGGDGVVGGHTYNDQEHVDYNQGTLGVAFLGNFEGDFLTTAADESVSTLLAEKAQLFSVSPVGTSAFRNRQDLPNIIGHRDVDATACPGTNVYAQLEALRQATQTKLAVLPQQEAPRIGAQLVSAPTLELAAEAGKTTTATVTYTNTSTVQWQSYILSRRVTVRPIARPSVFYSPTWLSDDAASTGDTANVTVNTNGVFSFSITAPQDTLEASEAFALFAPDGSEISGTSFRVHLTVENLDYAGRIEGITLAPATFLRHEQTATVHIHNIGRQAWQPGSFMVNVYDVGDRPSRFRATSWPAISGGFSLQEVVLPDAVTEIQVKLKTPATPGMYANVFRLVRVDSGHFATEDYRALSRADSPWKAELVKRTFPVAVKSARKKTLTVTFKNTGITTWKRSSVALRVYDNGMQPSRFSHPLWRFNGGKFTLQEKSVRPGEVGTFVVQLQSPSKKGLYKQVLRLEAQQKNILLQNNVYDFLTRVD